MKQKAELGELLEFFAVNAFGNKVRCRCPGCGYVAPPRKFFTREENKITGGHPKKVCECKDE